jgi:hypothetical protein
MAYKGKKSPCKVEGIMAGEQALEFEPPGKKLFKKMKRSIACPGGVCRPDRKTRKAIKKIAKRRASYS